MTKTGLFSTSVVLGTLLVVAGCKTGPPLSPDVSDSIHKSLDQAGLKKVSVSQDREKGVVTLGGSVDTAAEKTQAETLANSLAGGQVVADQIAVLPEQGSSDARAVNADVDKAIEKNLDAVLIKNKMHDHVRYSVKNGVVTLKGEVESDGKRSAAEQLAAGVPNVTQVVNDLDVKNRKATSTR